MTETAIELILTFSKLPRHERHAVLIELARISEDDNDPLADEELTFAGEQIFAMYDDEEGACGETSAG